MDDDDEEGSALDPAVLDQVLRIPDSAWILGRDGWVVTEVDGVPPLSPGQAYTAHLAAKRAGQPTLASRLFWAGSNASKQRAYDWPDGAIDEEGRRSDVQE